MIQDIAPAVFDNVYKLTPPGEKDRIVLFAAAGRKVYLLADAGEEIVLPPASLFASFHQEQAMLSSKLRLQYLFSIDETSYYTLVHDGSEAVFAEIEKVLGDAYELQPLFLARKSGPREDAFAVETAWQLYGWYRDNRFCGRCGSLMQPGVKERNMCCPACKNTVYPKIMPAVIVGVTKGDQILMTRYKGREYGGHALIAGFCEIGETGEDTVRREVMEEAGIHVKNIRYYKSQPWGFESDLLLGYFCEADGDEEIRMDDDELSEAVWIKRDEIEEHFENMSLTNEMICHFKGEI